MPIYNYQAFDGEGTLHKGTKDAATETEVRQYLRSKDLFPKEIRTSRFTGVKLPGGEKSTKIKIPKLSFRKGVPGKLSLNSQDSWKFCLTQLFLMTKLFN